MSLFDDVSETVTVHLPIRDARDELGNDVREWDAGTETTGIVVPGYGMDLDIYQQRPDGAEVNATLYMRQEFDSLREARVDTSHGTFEVQGDPLPWPPVVDGWRWSVPMRRVEG